MLRRILKFTAIGCGGVLALIIIVRVGSLDGGGDVTSTPERTDAEPRGGDTTPTPEGTDAQRRITDAQPRIKVSCDVYATNRVDPIADSEHLHRQIGNTSLTNESTGESLFASTGTSCDMPWFTSAGWFPVERYEPVRAVNVYYRAPGDQTEIRRIPTGLQLLGDRIQYRCNNTPSEEEFQDSPPFNCRNNFDTRVTFPDCWNRQSREETSMVYGNYRGGCPSTHPYRIPRISYLIMHDNTNDVIADRLRVSAGVDAWESRQGMHADYFAANQSVFDNELLDLCLGNASDSVRVADPRCGAGPN